MKFFIEFLNECRKASKGIPKRISGGISKENLRKINEEIPVRIKQGIPEESPGGIRKEIAGKNSGI